METSRGDEGRSGLPPTDYFTSGRPLPRGPGVDDRPLGAYDLAHFERRLS